LHFPSFQPGDIEGFRGVILHGARAYVETMQGERFTGEVWLPNFNVPGFSPYGLLEDIGVLLALERLKQKMNKHRVKQ
jgi:hypothetical protein